MSERIVEFALRVAESDLVDIDCLPEPTDVVCRRSGGPTFYEWELRESDWSRIATLRAALPEDASLWSEDATLQRVLPQNLSAATLIKLSPPQEERLRLSNGAIRARCSTCGHGSWQLGPDGVPPVLHGPLNDRGVFLPKGSSCLILHDDVLHSLRKAGLDKGIHATPVTWAASHPTSATNL